MLHIVLDWQNISKNILEKPVYIFQGTSILKNGSSEMKVFSLKKVKLRIKKWEFYADLKNLSLS